MNQYSLINFSIILSLLPAKADRFVRQPFPTYWQRLADASRKVTQQIPFPYPDLPHKIVPLPKSKKHSNNNDTYQTRTNGSFRAIARHS